MTITIDDGTFLVGNSFVTIEEADAYHTDRLNSDWVAAEESTKEAALIRAFDYLSVKNWLSTAFSDGIPIRVENAQCVAALKELQATGALQPDITPGLKKKEIDGVISTEYFESSVAAGGTIYTAVENMIEPYLATSAASSRRTITLVRG